MTSAKQVPGTRDWTAEFDVVLARVPATSIMPRVCPADTGVSAATANLPAMSPSQQAIEQRREGSTLFLNEPVVVVESNKSAAAAAVAETNTSAAEAAGSETKYSAAAATGAGAAAAAVIFITNIILTSILMLLL